MSRKPWRLEAPRACVAAAVLLAAAQAPAAEVKLARHPDYHKGKVVFSYLGDLWTASDTGANPRRLTVHRARDVHPRFSPDGKWIAFSSDRYGNYDVFVMPAAGGHAKRLTFHSAADTVVGWSRDSRKVLFSSARGLLYPGIPNLYEVPVGGGLEQPVLTDWGYWGSYSPDGKKLAFNRHPMVWWRKHYRGSYAADLWVLDLTANKFKRILDNDTPDAEKPNNLWPMYAGADVYFVSDRGVRAKSGSPEVLKSTNNIWKVPEEGGEAVQVTFHKSGALFWPSLSADGKTIVYEENFGLWKLDVATGKTAEIKLDITSDGQENNLQTQLVSDADSYDLSPSGKRAVVSVRGELFTVATEKGDIRRLTSTPKERETVPHWSPDAKWIAFVGDRTGRDEVWLCDERGGQMKQLSDGDATRSQLRWSPDAKALLYVSGSGGLYRYDLGTAKTTLLAHGEVAAFGAEAIGNPQWSPDGKWISYTKADRTLLPHVYIVPATGGPARRLTEPDSYSDTAALWTADGKRIVYLAGLDVANIGQRGNSTAQIYSISLLPEAADPADKGVDSEAQAVQPPAPGTKPSIGIGPNGKPMLIIPKVEVKINFERIGRRARQLTRTPDTITSMVLAPSSQVVVFVTTATEGGRPVQTIWSQSLDGDKLARVAQATQTTPEEGAPRGAAAGNALTSLQFTRDGKTLYFKQGGGIYAIGAGGAEAAPAGGAGRPTAPGATPGAPRRVTFTARVEIDRRARYRQVFHESWRVMKHRFYAEDMHGVDWNKVKAVYEPLLDHVADQEELHNVINQMIGELNASHTGISGGFATPDGPPAATRFPGFEVQADKSGYYRVTHVYRRGPADKDYVKIRAGDYLLAVDGEPLKAGDNYWKLFTAAPASKLEFTVNAQPGLDGAWKTRVKPVSAQQQAALQYEKWVDERRAMVERLSGGEFGYLHIRQMNEPSLRRFERDLTQLRTKKALLIDQRFNPGGNIDQELLQILGQRQYQVTRLRNSIHVTRPLRAFFGPMVVMANERSTSDAEVFPDGFRTLKLGKVVGVTTYGAVIGTGAFQLMDGSVIRTPGTGLWNIKGTNLENNGVPPDVYVDNAPEDFFRGRDAQLERAVEVLRQELAQRK